ncbi:DUF2256 domain-containing protein [uncultured Xylophilus sp.]|uniref:DUF2256 domain-containing protein n=1 Tax=uncultured Xylophilus sp. TaxID=296832 RepID=UPI0025F1DD63|nr:DUF2256 domain-containing protein [uncultured Xylophilus sp.]
MPDTPRPPGFKGNKSFLPQKPCATCGRPMTWRKRWAKNWDEVRYCSDACRKAKPGGTAARARSQRPA